MGNEFRSGERIYFRPLEIEDLEFLQGLVAREELHPYLGIYWPLNRRAEREWLEGLYKNREAFPFGIVLKEGDRLIGTCELRMGQAAHRAAEVGIGIREPEHRSRGYGAEAIGLLLAYGFGTLNLNRIELKQSALGYPSTATRLADMDLVALAGALGCDGARAETSAELESAVAKAADLTRPLVIEARIDPAQYQSQF